MVTLIFYFSPHFLSLRSLSTISNSSYLFAVVLHSPPILSRSLLTQFYLSLHSRSSSPPFPFIFWASDLFTNFSISNSFLMSSPFQHIRHQFLLKTFLHSNFHSQFIHSSLIRPLHSYAMILLIQLFHKPVLSFVVFLLVLLFLTIHLCQGNT